MVSAIRTAEQLLRAGDIGRCELVRGELVMLPPTGGRHGQIASRIAYALSTFLDRRPLGSVLVAGAGFLLARDPDTVRAPDVGFGLRDREIGETFIDGAPDLAVEVLSPEDGHGHVQDRVTEWLAAGSHSVWVVDPRARTVWIHRAGHEPRLHREDDVLRGIGDLAAFELPLRSLFHAE